MKTITTIYIIVILLLINSIEIFCQVDKTEYKKILKNASTYFDNEEYSKALPLYLKLDSLQSDSYIKYQIGVCYLNSKYQKKKAIPYFEAAQKDKTIENPVIVYKDLGVLYHLDYQFDKALECFTQYNKLARPDDKYRIFVRRMIEICENAKIISNKKANVTIEKLGYPVNTNDAEFRPLISTDENVLYFVRQEFKNIAENYGFELTGVIQTIMVSVKEDGLWSQPVPLELPVVENAEQITLAGLSPDGEMLFLNIKIQGQTDIYYCKPINYKKADKIVKLNNNINSRHNEGNVSITADGRTLYFSSNRPGGFGQMDLYKSELDESGDWDKPVNLGNTINSAFNEESPFIHPDGKTLYFSSQGHKTIGGYDIFKSVFNDVSKSWSTPENIGYPNTTQDDIDFVLSASGQIGYFSSSQNNLQNLLHIFKIDLKSSIPLTMVKGKILAGMPLKPVGARIRVVDRATNKYIKYVYSPNPETGKYLMIFPPDKNYDIIVEAPGFLPQLINIYIPNQTYFYELFQEIHLIPVTALGKVVGEELFVKNTFYDIYSTSMADSVRKANLRKNEKDYVKLLQIVEDIITTTDSSAADILGKQIPPTGKDIPAKNANYDKLLKLIEQAIETTDSTALTLLDQNTAYDQKTGQTFFYPSDNNKAMLFRTIVGDDTIYSSKPLDTKRTNKPNPLDIDYQKKMEELRVEKEPQYFSMKQVDPSKKKLILTFTVFFETGKSDIAPDFYQNLDELVALLMNNQNIGTEIYGHADTVGDEVSNLNLSYDRAKSILNYFINKGVNSRKMVLRGLGEKNKIELNDHDKQYDRRAEIMVYEILE